MYRDGGTCRVKTTPLNYSQAFIVDYTVGITIVRYNQFSH
jgi:hypothetical protein